MCEFIPFDSNEVRKDKKCKEEEEINNRKKPTRPPDADYKILIGFNELLLNMYLINKLTTISCRIKTIRLWHLDNLCQLYGFQNK